MDAFSTRLAITPTKVWTTSRLIERPTSESRGTWSRRPGKCGLIARPRPVIAPLAFWT